MVKKSQGFGGGGNFIIPSQEELKKEAARERDKQQIFREIELGGNITSKDIARNTNLTAMDKVEISQYKIQKQQNDKMIKEEEAYKKELTKAQIKRKAYLEQQEFNRHIGNYQPKNYIRNVASFTASAITRRPFNRSGLRQEFRSAGYTENNIPASDFENKTTSLVKGRVKGTLNIGNVGMSGITGVIPSFNINLGSGIGKGNVIMPTGILKIKGRKKI